MAVIKVQNKIVKQVRHKKSFNFKSWNSCTFVLINNYSSSLLKPCNQTTTSRHKTYFFPTQVNNCNNPSAEQFCTLALGNEGDKTPDKVSTTSALIYFLTRPQRPTSEIECPEHQSPTERIEFPNREMEVRPPAEVQGIKPSVNTHRALSERPEIPAGEDREERKGRKRKETKKI